MSAVWSLLPRPRSMVEALGDLERAAHRARCRGDNAEAWRLYAMADRLALQMMFPRTPRPVHGHGPTARP